MSSIRKFIEPFCGKSGTHRCYDFITLDQEPEDQKKKARNNYLKKVFLTVS